MKSLPLFVATRGDVVVGCLQLTIIPGMSRLGAIRGPIEGVRVASAERRQKPWSATPSSAAVWRVVGSCSQATYRACFQPILYGIDGDLERTGTVFAPTAPPGKVCIYMDRWGSGMRFYNGQALPLPTKGFKVAWSSDGTAPVEEMSGAWAYRAP